MHNYSATINWEDPSGAFAKGTYSRAHRWSFDGGVQVDASASPLVVRPPYSREDAIDPEEAFVASLASCHMLTFLYLAGKAKLVISRYTDQAIGTMETNADGQQWMSLVELNPEISFVGRIPDPSELERLHEQAHAECYIANSVKSEVRVKL